MQHIVIHYAGAFDDFAGIATDEQFHIDGRWTQQTVRQILTENSREVNDKRREKGLQPLYATGYSILGNSDYSDANANRPMPFVVGRQHGWHMQYQDKTLLLIRNRPEAAQVWLDGVRLGDFLIEEDRRGTRVLVGDNDLVRTIKCVRTDAPYQAVRYLLGR